MNRARVVALAIFLAALAVGTARDRPIARPPLVLGGYRVLAADFHTHSSMWSDGFLTPFDLVLEAERQGLDVIAITAHNEVVDAKAGQWWSRHIGGPLVLVGEEIVSSRYHMVAAGIQSRVSFWQSAEEAIDAVHAQGGIAIAAHPTRQFWRAYDARAREILDGAEICHPLMYLDTEGKEEIRRFFQATNAAAIGSSDFHGFGPIGLCRTYVFVTEPTETGVIDAVRAGRTVVYGGQGRVYGDPALIPLAEAAGLRTRAPSITDRGNAADWFSRVAGLAGLLGLAAFGAARDTRIVPPNGDAHDARSTPISPDL